ncbi:hypothetical protein KKH24_01455 [Patescibacteria group bacterium]|nr:hypothetical protein [Patescibacteria group bacterium]
MKLKINYNLSLSELIQECKYNGTYDQVSKKINTDNFPIQHEDRQEWVEAKLYPLKSGFVVEEEIKKMNENGYRPATFIEVLTLSAKYPELQRSNLIVALSPVIENYVLTISGNPTERSLSLFELKYARTTLVVCK